MNPSGEHADSQVADATTETRRRGGMNRTRWTLAAVAAAAALTIGGVVAAARDGGPPAAAPSAAAPDDGGEPVPVVVPGRPGETASITDSDRVQAPDGSPYNGIDVEFVRMMIPHHTQALRMAVLAPDRAGDPRITAIAERIRAAQVPEIRQLQAWLKARGLPEEVPGHDHASMPGMQTDEDLRALAGLRGGEFDRRFVEMMSAHHRGAVQMAGDVLKGGDDLAIHEMANEMAVEQSAEIERMRQLGVG